MRGIRVGLTILIERLQEVQEEAKRILAFIKEQYGMSNYILQ